MKSFVMVAAIMSALSAAPVVAQNSSDETTQSLQTLTDAQRAALASVLSGLPRQ